MNTLLKGITLEINPTTPRLDIIDDGTEEGKALSDKLRKFGNNEWRLIVQWEILHQLKELNHNICNMQKEHKEEDGLASIAKEGRDEV